MRDQIRSEIDQKIGLINLFLGAAKMVANRTDDLRRLNGINGMVSLAERHPQIIAPLAIQVLRRIAKTEPNELLRGYTRLHIDTCQRVAPGIKSGPEIEPAPSLKNQAKRVETFIRRAEHRTRTLAKRYLRRDLTQPR